MVKRREKMLNSMEDITVGWLAQQPLSTPFSCLPPLQMEMFAYLISQTPTQPLWHVTQFWPIEVF